MRRPRRATPPEPLSETLRAVREVLAGEHRSLTLERLGATFKRTEVLLVLFPVRFGTGKPP